LSWGFLFEPENTSDHYSVRWEGYLDPPTTEEYTF
jgi:hypothetical protein